MDPTPDNKPSPETLKSTDELLELIKAQNKALEAMAARLDTLENKNDPKPEPPPVPKIIPNDPKPEPPPVPKRTYSSILADIKSNKEDK